MTSVGEQIRSARRRAHLDVETLARLAEIDPDRVALIEMGHAMATPEEADQCARVFGIGLRDLVGGMASQSPMRVLLKGAQDHHRAVIDALIETRAIDELGSFQRCVRDVAELEALQGVTRTSLPTALYGDPERLAKMFRLQRNLDLRPIVSMRALLEALGISVFFTTPARLHSSIDGASTDWPRPAVLVNLVRGRDCWWRTRMTLGHELAHLLFDMQEHRTLFSPHVEGWSKTRTTGRWKLFDLFDDVEVRADAFAACLLAPRDAVLDEVRQLDPTSNEAILRVASRFGVGRIVAINRLLDVCSQPAEERQKMLDRSTGLTWSATFEEDVVSEQEVGLRRGAMRGLVTRALSTKKIGRVRAREFLGLSLTEPLILEEHTAMPSAPPISGEANARHAAVKHVARRYPDAEFFADRVEREGDHWVVVVMSGGAGATEVKPFSVVVTSDDGVVLEERSNNPGA